MLRGRQLPRLKYSVEADELDEGDSTSFFKTVAMLSFLWFRHSSILSFHHNFSWPLRVFAVALHSIAVLCFKLLVHANAADVICSVEAAAVCFTCSMAGKLFICHSLCFGAGMASTFEMSASNRWFRSFAFAELLCCQHQNNGQSKCYENIN